MAGGHRRAARVDANQPQIVDRLRALGCSVASTAALGQGFPDIVVGYRGSNYLFEIKDPAKKPSERRLTPAESLFHRSWGGQVDTIHTWEDVCEIIGMEVSRGQPGSDRRRRPAGDA